MASTCFHKSFSFAPLTEYGVQPSRVPALKGVSENGDIVNSGDDDDDDDDDDGLPSVSKILTKVRQRAD